MRYHLIALFTVFVWGITFVSTKVLLNDLTPLQILLLRFAIGFIVLCSLRPHLLDLKKRDHELLFIAAGATGIAAYYLLENVALVYTSTTAVGVIVASSPLFTALIQALLGDRSQLNPRFLLGFIVAMGGLISVGIGSGGSISEMFAANAGAFFGNILSLCAALVWAIYSLLVMRIAELGYETIASTKRTFFWGLVFILPATLVFGGSFPPPDTIDLVLDGANLLFLGAVASAACFVTWGTSVKHLGAARSTAYIYLVPAITAASAIAILGEPLTPLIISGLALTIAGLMLSQSRPTTRDLENE